MRRRICDGECDSSAGGGFATSFDDAMGGDSGGGLSSSAAPLADSASAATPSGESSSVPAALADSSSVPAAQADATEQVGVGAHTDSGFLTLLLQDDSGGLQAFTRGEWLDVTPLGPDCVVACWRPAGPHRDTPPPSAS